MNFATVATENLVVKPSAVEAFNVANELSLIYSPHSWHTQAQAAIELIEPGTYVGIEKVSFERQELARPFDDFIDTIPKGEKIDDFNPAFLKRFAGRLAYDGLELFELRERNEARFNLYKERAFEELDSVEGIIGLNPLAGYYLKLELGILEKGGVYGPADADNVQLPQELADRLRLNTGERDAIWSDMHHYRDRALVYNLVTDSLRRYREVLGTQTDKRLPITIVRGSGHRVSLGAILKEHGIKYQGVFFENPHALIEGKQEFMIPASFSVPKVTSTPERPGKFKKLFRNRGSSQRSS